MPVPDRFHSLSTFHPLQEPIIISSNFRFISVLNASHAVKESFSWKGVLAVLGIGKISKKGIMKEGCQNLVQPAKQDFI